MKKFFIGALVPLILLISWQYGSSTGLINPLFFPAPTEIAATGFERLLDGSLITHTLTTLTRILVSFVIGGVIGYFVGVITGLNRFLNALLEPTFSVLYTIPKIVLFPIFLLIFGLGEAPKIATASTTVFFYVWVNTLSSVRNIPSEYLAICRSITKSRRALFLNVIVPASAPAVFTGLRIGVAVATLITISTEFVNGNSGLGYLIFNSRILLRYEDAYLGIVIVGILGYILQTGVVLTNKFVNPWQKTGFPASNDFRG